MRIISDREKARAAERERTPECRAMRKAWRAANPDKTLGYSRNPKTQARRIQWKKENPDRCKIYYHNKYVQRKLSVGADKISREQWEALKRTHDGRCAYCGEVKPLTMDHKIPLCRGGKHVIENIAPACKPCNSRKWKKTVEEFALGSRRNPS